MLNENPNSYEYEPFEPPKRRNNKRMLRACIAFGIAVALLIITLVFALLQYGGENESESTNISDDETVFDETSESIDESSLNESSEMPYDESFESSESDEEYFPAITVVTPENVTAAAIFESDSLHCIYSENIDSRLSIASITKLITASVAIKYMPIDTVITVGSELSLVKYDSSVCGLKQGYELTLEQLLYGLLMSSGNDAAYTIAVNVARYVAQDAEMSDKDAVEYFCGLMNELSAEIGAENSSFANPEGWDDENNYSTVSDLVIISKYAKGFELIEKIVRTTEYTIVFPGVGELIFRNSNYLLHEESRFYCPYVTGLKTGSTSSAGKCLVATVDIDGFEYIAVVMGCPNEEARYTSMLALIESIKEYNNLKFA